MGSVSIFNTMNKYCLKVNVLSIINYDKVLKTCYEKATA